MSNIKSEFPRRLRGIWRSGSLRPSDFVPEPVLAPSADETRRRERYRVQRGRTSAPAGDAERDTPSDGPPELGAVLGTLAERLREHVQTTAARQETAEQTASGERPSTPVAAAPPRRRRRSGLGALVRLVIIAGFLAFLYGKMFDVDMEMTLNALLAEAEQALSGDRRESAPVVETGSIVASAPVAVTASLARNGSFESPPFNGETDTGPPEHWEFAGERVYPRVRGNSHGYPRAPDGTTMLAVHGEYHGTLYQNLVPMETGVTYTFRAVVLHSSGENSYRASLWRVEQNRQRELAFISDKQVSPPDYDGFPVSFSYTASTDDAGKLLRVQLSDNGTKRRTRSAFDDVTVRAER